MSSQRSLVLNLTRSTEYALRMLGETNMYYRELKQDLVEVRRALRTKNPMELRSRISELICGASYYITRTPHDSWLVLPVIESARNLSPARR